MKFATPFALLFSTALLGGCATAFDGTTQQIMFRSVGADDAYCIIQSGDNGYRYEANLPQVVRIHKSRDPLVASCSAPGNRKKTVQVQPRLTSKTALNTFNMGLGAIVDAESGAMYSYPSEVIVDFTGISAQSHALPSYENEGALDPKVQGIENFGPEIMTLPGEMEQQKHYKDVMAEHEAMLEEKAAYEKEKQRRIGSVEGGFYGDKGGKWAETHPAKKITKKSKIAQDLSNTEEDVTIPKPVTDASRKYTPPKTSPAEITDDSSAMPLPLGGDGIPVAPLEKGDEPAVSITPLSQAVPDSSTDGGVVVGGDSSSPVTVTPLTDLTIPMGPTLTSPLFPSSTSF